MTTITQEDFMNDRQGRTFSDVWDNPQHPFAALVDFFADDDRQRRMEEAETHHDRPALAGVVRELESQPEIDGFLTTAIPRDAKRFRQATGVLVRIIMEARGWQKTGRKGSLGVRSKPAPQNSTEGTQHNTGGLAFWFLRAERYQPQDGLPYPTVKERCLTAKASRQQVNS